MKKVNETQSLSEVDLIYYFRGIQTNTSSWNIGLTGWLAKHAVKLRWTKLGLLCFDVVRRCAGDEESVAACCCLVMESIGPFEDLNKRLKGPQITFQGALRWKSLSDFRSLIYCAHLPIWRHIHLRFLLESSRLIIRSAPTVTNTF